MDNISRCLDFPLNLEPELGMEVEMSLKEKEGLGDGGDGTSYSMFREAEFFTKTGRKIRED